MEPKRKEGKVLKRWQKNEKERWGNLRSMYNIQLQVEKRRMEKDRQRGRRAKIAKKKDGKASNKKGKLPKLRNDLAFQTLGQLQKKSRLNINQQYRSIFRNFFIVIV